MYSVHLITTWKTPCLLRDGDLLNLIAVNVSDWLFILVALGSYSEQKGEDYS